MENSLFKYHPNFFQMGILSKNNESAPSACQCCGSVPEFYYPLMMYAVEDVDCLCVSCIESGKAAAKFDGEFIQNAELGKVTDQEKINELFMRTPGYLSWQGEHWLACCQDFCAYLGEVGTKELEELGIKDEVIQRYYQENEHFYSEIEDYLTKNGDISGYLFQCLHCKEYRLYVDAS